MFNAKKNIFIYLAVFASLIIFVSFYICYSIYSKYHAGEYSFLLEPFFYFSLILALLAFICLFYIFQLEKKNQRKLLALLNTDELTSLLSMHAFKEKVSLALEQANSDEYEIIVFDIDHFSAINKYFGRNTGIEIIRTMAETLKKAYLETDIYISRINAEEFIIFKKVHEGMNIEKLIELFILPSVQCIIGKNYNFNMSVGIYIIKNTEDKIADLIDCADLARLKGKNYYKTSFIYFCDAMREEISDTIEITFRMENALKEKEFFVKFQPKIDFKTLKINGAEALVRWKPKLGEQIYPDRFIKVMERNGFIFELDLYVFKEVCKFISKYSKNIFIPKIAVNFSPITLAEDKIITLLQAIMMRFDVSSSQIEIELTESAFVDYEDILIERIDSFRKLGFSVAVDDFGTGVSSLNRLSVMNVDVLKLDKSFLFANQNTKGSLVVEQMIILAKNLGMKVVSEGVENIVQVEWLRSLQCDTAQGYYFSRPISEEEFIAYIKNDIK